MLLRGEGMVIGNLPWWYREVYHYGTEKFTTVSQRKIWVAFYIASQYKESLTLRYNDKIYVIIEYLLRWAEVTRRSLWHRSIVKNKCCTDICVLQGRCLVQLYRETLPLRLLLGGWLGWALTSGLGFSLELLPDPILHLMSLERSRT